MAVGPGVGPTATDEGIPGTSGVIPSAIVVAFAEGLDTPGFGAVSLLGDGYGWLVPTFVAGVPGLLIVLIILIQLLGGVIWTPSDSGVCGATPSVAGPASSRVPDKYIFQRSSHDR